MFILHTGRTLIMSPPWSQDFLYLIFSLFAYNIHTHIYERVFCSPVWPPVHYVADLELLIFLPSSPECWYYKSVLPHMVYIELGIKCMTLCMLNKLCACQTVSPTSLFIFHRPHIPGSVFHSSPGLLVCFWRTPAGPGYMIGL